MILKSAKGVPAGDVSCPGNVRRFKDSNVTLAVDVAIIPVLLLMVAVVGGVQGRLTVIAKVSPSFSHWPHCVAHSAANSNHLQ